MIYVKRVFIVHGWGGSPAEAWFPWLKSELEKQVFKAEALKMPDPSYPQIETWVSFLSDSVGTADKDTYFVGGSIGCQTILRYLEGVDAKVGGIVLVAGWFDLLPAAYTTEEDREIAKPWIETSIDFKKVKSNVKSIVSIFSDNDPFVDLKEAERFKKNLGAKIIVEKGKGHFAPEDNINELPVVLEELLKMSK